MNVAGVQYRVVSLPGLNIINTHCVFNCLNIS